MIAKKKETIHGEQFCKIWLPTLAKIVIRITKTAVNKIKLNVIC